MGEHGMDMDTLLYFKWVTLKDLMHSMGTLLTIMQSLDGREFKGECIHVYV